MDEKDNEKAEEIKEETAPETAETENEAAKTPAENPETPPENEATEQPENAETAETPPAPPVKKDKSNILIAIIAAVGVALVAAGLAVFFITNRAPDVPAAVTDTETEEQTDKETETETETEAETEEEQIVPTDNVKVLQADKLPSAVTKDFYKSDEKLFNRAVMYSANELKGKFDNVIFKYDGLTVQSSDKVGTFTSNDIKLDEFKKLIISWNANTKGGTVEVAVKIKLPDGSYTEPYSWGVWSVNGGVSKSKSKKDENGTLDIDTLMLKQPCTAVKLVIKLTQTGDEPPVLYNVTFATDRDKQTVSKNTSTDKVKLKVKKRYQYDVSEIGGVICSPTSLSMVRDYYGEKGFNTRDTADGVYDNKEKIYGNWSFNVAYAGELGYNAFVDIYDIKALKWALSKDVPVICSVKIKKGQLSGSGFPDYSTNGHLMCVIGYETVDGKDYLIVNDPAIKQVEVRYLVSEFETIWPGTAYIVQKKPERYTWRIGEGTEQDIVVVADYVPEGRYNRPGGNFKVKSIVIHNTGNFTSGADANSHKNYIKQDGTKTSWHYTVDDKVIFKHLPEEERAWHAGDGREGAGNTNGIGIEICVNHETLGTKNPSGYFYKALDNAAQLVAELMYKYKLTIKQVKQHYDYSGKNCPQVIRENDLWEPFLKNVQERYDKIKAERG